MECASVLCLIAICLGYQVFVQGSKEDKPFRLLGRVIGIVVIFSAVIIYMQSNLIMCGGFSGQCPMKVLGL